MKVNNDLLLNFGGIVVNTDLPKYKLLEERKKKIQTAKEGELVDNSVITSPSESPRLGKEERSELREKLVGGDLSDYISKADAKDFNVLIASRLLRDTEKYVSRFSVPIEASGPIKEGDEKGDGASDPEYTLDITDIFNLVHIETGHERDFINRVHVYCELLRKAQEMGQVAQEDILTRGLIVHIYESVLCVSGFSQYIELSKLKDLQLKCRRQLDLDYLQNFTRVIPDKVVEKKKKADELLVFDNYMVLHYDPSGAARQLTEEEKIREMQRRTDPVLFGVIEGSQKLYYIGDWVDEFCDLTWDQIVEKIDVGELKQWS